MYRYRFTAAVTAAFVAFMWGTASAFAMPAPSPDPYTGRGAAPAAPTSGVTAHHAASWPVVVFVVAAVVVAVVVMSGAVRARQRRSATVAPAH